MSKKEAKKTNKLTLSISICAITAALYITLGYVFQPISFLGLQFRVAELIVGICILYPYSGMTGKIIGVFFVNLTSPLGMIDLLSVFANIPALFCIVFLRNYKLLRYIGGVLYSLVISLYVALILNFTFGLPIPLMFVQVLISEIILVLLGIFIFNYIKTILPEHLLLEE